jgi:hypothetical protein
VNVVGSPGDSLTEALLEAAVREAGEDGVTFLDPSDPADSMILDSLSLPGGGWPYAQPCVGPACGRPVHTVEDLMEAVELLEND